MSDLPSELRNVPKEVSGHQYDFLATPMEDARDLPASNCTPEIGRPAQNQALECTGSLEHTTKWEHYEMMVKKLMTKERT